MIMSTNMLQIILPHNLQMFALYETCLRHMLVFFSYMIHNYYTLCSSHIVLVSASYNSEDLLIFLSFLFSRISFYFLIYIEL